MERDFTYIDDVVAGILAALDHPPVDNGHEKPGGSIGPHSLYNIGNNRAERLGRVIDLLESEIGRPAIRRHLPMQPGDVSSTRADIAPIQKQFGFVPQTTIDEGIPKFVRWYRDFHGLEDRHTISPTGLPTRAAAPAPHVMAD
jgi:UDP-glucuronate 4-epimerase